MRSLIVLTLFISLASESASACDKCFVLPDNPFALPHPHTVQIAVATRKAREDGVLWTPKALPPDSNSLDLAMIRFANVHFDDLGERAESPVIMDVLLVDESALYRIEASHGKVNVWRLDGIQHHASKTRLITTSPVVESFGQTTITMTEAARRGCLEVEGDRTLLNHLESVLASE